MKTIFHRAPGALPLIGHAGHLRRRPLEFLSSLAALGDLIEIRLGRRTAYVPTHPELIWQVLVDSRTFDKGGPVFEKARYVLGNGLATCVNDDHRRQRRMMQPGFHGSRLPGYGSIMTQIVDEAISSWQDGRILDVTEAMMSITTRVAARTLASTAMSETAVCEILSLYPIITHGVYQRIIAPFGIAERLPTRSNHRYRNARDRLRALVDETIAHHHASGTYHEDLMSSLLVAQDADGSAMTVKELHDQIIILLTGEVETTGAALSWAFHLIAQHPQVEQQLQDEADNVLAGRIATWEDLPKLPIAARVLTESLRIWPPVWFLTRSVSYNTTLGGQPISRGSIIVFSSYIIHRHPAFYAEPDNFDPDRWLPGRHEHLPRGAFVPFAAGSRKCIGHEFAMGEATIALASISSRWKLERVPGVRVEPVPRAILRPRALPMRIRARGGRNHAALPPEIPKQS
ncbi:MAG: cytochrome P450 [Pseudonocardiaceae bacterium]